MNGQVRSAAGLSLASEYATRCSELMRSGYLIDTPLARSGATGMRRMVRRITSAGLDALSGAGKPGTTPNGPTPASALAPVFGDLQLIRAMRR